MSFKLPEQYRFSTTTGKLSLWATQKGDTSGGCFIIQKTDNLQIRCIASSGLGWEHVSVSVEILQGKQRCPYWDEMCFVKDLFWDDTDVVIQYHPAKADYVSQHHFCLHLWRPIGVELPRPDPLMVGINSDQVITAEEIVELLKNK